MVEAATLAGVTAFICFNIGFWPAYGLLTPLVVSVVTMGAFFSLHFLPPI
jgi:hypothetical protein